MEVASENERLVFIDRKEWRIVETRKRKKKSSLLGKIKKGAGSIWDAFSSGFQSMVASVSGTDDDEDPDKTDTPNGSESAADDAQVTSSNGVTAEQTSTRPDSNAQTQSTESRVNTLSSGGPSSQTSATDGRSTQSSLSGADGRLIQSHDGTSTADSPANQERGGATSGDSAGPRGRVEAGVGSYAASEDAANVAGEQQRHTSTYVFSAGSGASLEGEGRQMSPDTANDVSAGGPHGAAEDIQRSTDGCQSTLAGDSQTTSDSSLVGKSTADQVMHAHPSQTPARAQDAEFATSAKSEESATSTKAAESTTSTKSAESATSTTLAESATSFKAAESASSFRAAESATSSKGAESGSSLYAPGPSSNTNAAGPESGSDVAGPSKRPPPEPVPLKNISEPEPQGNICCVVS